MQLSRRDALRVGGGLLAAGGLAGCIEQRVTQRETHVQDGATWALTPDVGAALDREAFETYVDEVAAEYGDSGMWGLEEEPDGSFETAYVQRLGVASETPGEASLDPDSLELESPLLVADAAVAVYEIDGSYRYWLWLAADGTDDRLARHVDVSVLSTRLSFPDTELTRGAGISTSDGEGTVTLEDETLGRFPVGDGDDVEATTESGEDGSYVVEWTGSVEGAQSVNGACVESRDGEHDFRWGIAAGYRRSDQV